MGIEQIIAKAAEVLWVGGLAATPLAVVVSLVCRARSVRPATRHMLWFAVLASFVTPAVGSLIWRPHWFQSERVMAAAGMGGAGTGTGTGTGIILPSVGEQASGRAGDAQETGVPKPRPEAAPAVVHSRNEPGDRARPGTVQAPAMRPIEGGAVRDAAVRNSGETRLAGDLAGGFVGPMPVLTGVDRARRRAGTPVPVAAANPSVNPAPIIPAPVAAAAPIEVEQAATRSEVASAPAGVAAPAGGADGAKQPSGEPGPVRAWLVRLLNVRDAVAELPPVPTTVWLGGSVLIVVLSLWRRWMGMRWLRNATPAGPQVLEAVRQVAEALGLSRAPRVVFVHAAVSPMIWCGLRPLLVLPTSLWRTLDEDSRRSVLVHELAHVRRWDHLLCWLEAGIGAIYWWHPVVWWVRRRLHEEAEASCDTWVTTLFPANRRAYASALVVTKSFVSSRAESRGPWLGVASGSAKRLARRITMVMTHKSAPRMSMVGVFVTTLVIATGAFVMPGLACPPEDEAKAKQKAEEVARAKAKSRTPVARAPRAVEPEVSFFGEAPALEAMRERQPALAPTPPAPPQAPQPAKAPKAPKPPKAPKAPQPPSAMSVPGVPGVPLMSPTVPMDLEALKVGREPREYILSEGKLEAFYGMMSRGDVPILVQLQGDKIVIWGNDDEHAVFSKFVRIVDGGALRPRSDAADRNRTVARAEAARVMGQQRTANVQAERAAADEYAASVRALTRDRALLERSVQGQAAEQAAAAGRADARRSLEDAQAARESALMARERATADRDASRELRLQIRELERTMRELEERAQRLEGQGERRPGAKSASPGMMGPAPVLSGCESACTATCEKDSGAKTSN